MAWFLFSSGFDRNLVEPMGASVKGQGSGSNRPEEIRGKMTLEEISLHYQVPAPYLIDRLKLPSDTSLQEPSKT